MYPTPGSHLITKLKIRKKIWIQDFDSIMMPAPQRFQVWAASTVFTTVCIAAHASTSRWDADNEGKWVLANFVISLVFSFMGVLAHFLIKNRFVGKIPEGGVALLLVILWVTGLPFIMNPDDHIAISGRFDAPTIINPNLFYFSWAGFASAFYIFGSFFQEFTERDMTSNVSPKNTKWGALLATCVVIVASAADIHDDAKCTNRDNQFCNRNAYGIALGVIGIVFPLLVLLMNYMGKLTTMIEFGVSFIMIVMTTCGVAFLTFGSGSATQMSNLYFATWISFGISVFLSSQCFREFMESRSGAETDEAVDVEKGEEKKGEPADEEAVPEVKEQPMSPPTEAVEASAEA